MAKSKIIKELVNEEITIEKALKRILLLANDIDNDDLKMWVEKELNGYESGDDIPEYRVVGSLNLIYSGINGGFQVTRSPLPMTYLNPETFDNIKKIKIFEPIGSIQDKANNTEGTLQMDRTYLAGEVYKNTYDGFDGIQCMSISQVFDKSQFANIIKKVNLKALNILMRLEKEFGNLDELDIETKNRSYVQNKKNFNLYWNLEALINIADLVSPDEHLLKILKITALSNDYTIREKTAKAAQVFGFEQVLESLKDDTNVYVKKYLN